MSRFSTDLSVCARVILAITRMNMLAVLAALILVGAGLYSTGIYAETHHQISLRLHGGEAAVVQYHNALTDNELEKSTYVISGLRGGLEQIGANAQVAGMAIMYAGSGIILVLTLIARIVWAMQVRMSPVAGRSSSTWH